MDGGSCCNCCSTRLVEKLNLQVVPHPKPYNLQWINENGEVRVDKQVEIKFSIGNYKDKVLCDIVPIDGRGPNTTFHERQEPSQERLRSS